MIRRENLEKTTNRFICNWFVAVREGKLKIIIAPSFNSPPLLHHAHKQVVKKSILRPFRGHSTQHAMYEISNIVV